MSVSTARKRKQSEKPKGIRAHKTLIAAVLGIATLLGGLAVVLPRPTVVQGDPVDVNNPFSAPFTITNTGFIPLTHINAYLALVRMTNEPAIFKELERPRLGRDPEHETWLFRGDIWTNHRLDMDERFTITPADLIECCGTSRVAGAEFAIVVEYQPWVLPVMRRKAFVFVTHRQTNGQLYWYSIPNE